MAEKLKVSELQIVDDEGRPRMVLSAYPMIKLLDEEGGHRGHVCLHSEGYGSIELHGARDENDARHWLTLALTDHGPELMLNHANGTSIRLHWEGEHPQITRGKS